MANLTHDIPVIASEDSGMSPLSKKVVIGSCESCHYELSQWLQREHLRDTGDYEYCKLAVKGKPCKWKKKRDK